MKVVDELLKNPSAWLKVGAPSGVMVSSRVRLARNLEGVAFPGWAGEEESVRLWQTLHPILETLPGCAAPVALEMDGLSRVDKEILIERHLISRDLAEKGRGSGGAGNFAPIESRLRFRRTLSRWTGIPGWLSSRHRG